MSDETLRNKIIGSVNDQIARLGEKMELDQDSWSAKNFTHPLGDGREAEVEIRVRMRKMDSDSFQE